MQYITDEHKNVTHVVVPLELWNSMLENRESNLSVNSYQSVIGWIEDKLKANSVEGSTSPFIDISKKTQTGDLFKNFPIYNMMRSILKNDILQTGRGSIQIKYDGLNVLLSTMYPFARGVDARTIAIAYILRNDEFYKALLGTNKNISDSNRKILSKFGFNIEKFKEEAKSELSNTLYTGNKSGFIFSAINLNIGEFFSLSPIKERIRREPELLRLFFFDMFDALNEMITEEPSFEEVFKQEPLVDRLATVVYPNNTLSGSTSRVYKSAKEARTIIAVDWQKYVSVI